MAKVGEEFDAHEADFLFGVVGVVLELFVGFVERGAFGVAPIVEQDFLMVGFDDIIYIVINIKFGAGGDDMLHLGEEFGHGDAAAGGDVFETLAAVDGTDNVDFES